MRLLKRENSSVYETFFIRGRSQTTLTRRVRQVVLGMSMVCRFSLNNRFLRERGMVSTPKMEYQVFLCILQKNSSMATLGLKEMGKFLWEGREKVLPCWLSQFSKTKLRQPTGQTFFPTFPKEFSHFLQT